MTDFILSEYLISSLGNLNQTQGYVADDFTFVCEETIALAGIDIAKQKKIGKYLLWKKILTDIAGDIDFNADGASYKRSDFWDHAQMMFSDAYAEAYPYLNTIGVSKIPIRGSYEHVEL